MPATAAHRSGGLGRPGIHLVSVSPEPIIVGVELDATAFFGVAPRGPARIPTGRPRPEDRLGAWLARTPVARTIAVRVTSWDEYRLHFGGYEGPGRLPYAVAAFFANGGRAADICRIVHDGGPADDPLAARSSAVLGSLTTAGGAVGFLARNEGAWGNRLRTTMRFRTRSLPGSLRAPTTFVTGVDEWVPDGSLLRVQLPGDTWTLHYVDASRRVPRPTRPGEERRLELDAPIAAPPRRVDVVTAELTTLDEDPAFHRREQLADLGLSPEHPRWVARAVIEESDLLWPSDVWVEDRVHLPDPLLADVASVGADGSSFSGGIDRWAPIVPDDFWDHSWTPGDDLAGNGLHAIAHRDDIGLVVTPDLFDPSPLPPSDDITDPVTLCGPDFGPHVDVGPAAVPPPVVPGLLGLRLDPGVPAERAEIVAAQRTLTEIVAHWHRPTLLLDVPPGLTQRQRLDWRTNFATADAAAFHPWIDVTGDDERDRLIRLNPSAFAAGIIAEREQRLGVHVGPANQIAVTAVRVADPVADDDHAELHDRGVNVFRAERDGVRLTGARTLATDARLRQLSVARLLTLIRLSLARELHWVTFEPNGPALWSQVQRSVHEFLRRLHADGAFRGATTKESFFVRCDETTMSRNDLDVGRMVCLVGVAPAEPIEHLLIEIAREADGQLQIAPTAR